jgi:hypothetical protein
VHVNGNLQKEFLITLNCNEVITGNLAVIYPRSSFLVFIVILYVAVEYNDMIMDKFGPLQLCLGTNCIYTFSKYLY